MVSFQSAPTLGVLIGMDESSSSARISRYETGIHEPPIATADKIANALKVPLPEWHLLNI
jgi:transcriptional regulator with XRE-family HTH domain